MENRNEACEMEVAVMGSRAKLRAKEGGKLNQGFSVSFRSECEFTKEAANEGKS